MPSFSKTLERSIHSALGLANKHKHEFATLEHLLLALLDEPEATRVINACDVDIKILRISLEQFVDEELVNLESSVDGSEAVPTAAFQRVVQRAAIHVQSSGRTEVTGRTSLLQFLPSAKVQQHFFLNNKE